jgi:hypothetical protein
MTALLLSLAIVASLAARIVTPPYNHDHTPERIHLQDQDQDHDQDRLHDGSCK